MTYRNNAFNEPPKKEPFMSPHTTNALAAAFSSFCLFAFLSVAVHSCFGGTPSVTIKHCDEAPTVVPPTQRAHEMGHAAE